MSGMITLMVSSAGRTEHLPVDKVQLVLKNAVKNTMRRSKQLAELPIRARYTYKPSVKKAMKVRTSGLTGKLIIRDSRHSLERFVVKRGGKTFTARKSSGNLYGRGRQGTLFAEVVRGWGGDIPRAFYVASLGGLYMRTTQERFPIKKLMSVAVAQQAGHPIPAQLISLALEERFEAELDEAMWSYL